MGKLKDIYYITEKDYKRMHRVSQLLLLLALILHTVLSCPSVRHGMLSKEAGEKHLHLWL